MRLRPKFCSAKKNYIRSEPTLSATLPAAPQSGLPWTLDQLAAEFLLYGIVSCDRCAAECLPEELNADARCAKCADMAVA